MEISLSHLVGDLEHIVRDYGVTAVMIILALEALGAPVPGETLLIFPRHSWLRAARCPCPPS